jgi:hypothetical protein
MDGMNTMFPSLPILRTVPVAVVQTDEQRIEWEQRRQAIQLEREQRVAAERDLLSSLGLGLVDLDAAARCGCGCHPKAAENEAHAQAECSCQLTDEERSQRSRQWLQDLGELDLCDFDTYAREAFDETAESLKVEEAAIRIFACPLVVSGVVHGRAFYLRERHDKWRVSVATPNDPAVDPWEGDREVIDIAEGSGCFTPAEALAVGVQQVRLYLQRVTCKHRKTTEDAPFCAYCGIRISDRDAWDETHLGSGVDVSK